MIATAEENRGTLFAYFLSDCICKLWLPQDKLSPPSQDLKQLMYCHVSLDRLLCPIETNYCEKICSDLQSYRAGSHPECRSLHLVIF